MGQAVIFNSESGVTYFLDPNSSETKLVYSMIVSYYLNELGARIME